jgi:3-carboxy-cis,cis-muconate cycloisomerase
MTSHVIDSKLLGHLFSSPRMKTIWNDQNSVRLWLLVERALANAEAKLGVIPVTAAEEIIRKAIPENIDFEQLAVGIRETSHGIVPLLQQVRERCLNEAGEYVHWGATTQDIDDTGFMLQIKEAYELLRSEMIELERVLVGLAKSHRATPMVGRTHAVHAVPISFGLKVAVWCSEMKRHLERWDGAASRILVGQLAGATGTVSTFGPNGFKIQELVMQELGLGVPDIVWHTSRDRLAEFSSMLAMCVCTCGKIANELINLCKTEIREIEEKFVIGKIGSSTMPHKRNPKTAEIIVALSKLVRNDASLMFDMLIHEHERDGAAWKGEWAIIPEICIYGSAALEKTTGMLKNMTVNADWMIRNMELTRGLIFSEAVMLELGKRIGRQTAHEIIYRLCADIFDEEISLKEALLKEPVVVKYFSPQEIDAMFDPSPYVLASAACVDRALDSTLKKDKMDYASAE